MKKKGCHIGAVNGIWFSTAYKICKLRKVLSTDYGPNMKTTSTKRYVSPTFKRETIAGELNNY